jgi:hypothetical protein
VEGFLALSKEEREAYPRARRGLMFGPNLLLTARSNAQGWEEVFGFGLLAVSLAVGTGETDQTPFGTAYLEADIDEADTRQRLLELDYQEKMVGGGTYYAIRRDRGQDLQAPTRRAGVLAQMNRVFLAEGVLAAGPDTDPIVDVVAAAERNTSVLSDDPVFSRLAVSLRQPLSAALLPRPAVLEPEGFARKLAYEKPEDWGTLHQWEALGAGYGVTEGIPWWAFSLYYPDAGAAEADASELRERMTGYHTAIIPLMYPDMSEEGLAGAPRYPSDQSCSALITDVTKFEDGSVLTVWCTKKEERSISWHMLIQTRDLGFLLP